MVVPSKAVVEHASRRDRLRQVVLEGRSKIIGIAGSGTVRFGLFNRRKFEIPEVEILREIDLFEDIHQTLLFSRTFDPMVRTDGYHLGLLAVIDIMTTQQGDDRTFGNDNHIPSCRKAYKTYAHQLACSVKPHT